MKERERAGEGIARFLYDTFNTTSKGSWEQLPKFNEVRQWWLMNANQILSIPELAILSDDQGLPYKDLREIPHGIMKAFKYWEDAEPRLREFAQDMLKQNFKRVI